MRKSLVALLVGVAVALGFIAWREHRAAPTAAVTQAAPAPALPAQPIAPVPSQASAPPAAPPRVPVASSGPMLGESDLPAAFAALVGARAAERFLQTDDFAHRFAATVDNLGRSAASPSLWPVQPTPGRFTVRQGAQGLEVDPDNSLRYAPFVLMVESIDPQRAVALYQRLYPRLQQAYEDLGFPRRSFQQRLIEVIDQLLDTPVVHAPLGVRLPVDMAASAPARPWLLYEFSDPAFTSLSAGQRILLRMGPVNERRLKTRLVALRAALKALPTQALQPPSGEASEAGE